MTENGPEDFARKVGRNNTQESPFRTASATARRRLARLSATRQRTTETTLLPSAAQHQRPRTFSLRSLRTLLCLEGVNKAAVVRGGRSKSVTDPVQKIKVVSAKVRFPHPSWKKAQYEKHNWTKEKILKLALLRREGNPDFMGKKTGFSKPRFWGTYVLHPGFPWFSLFLWFPWFPQIRQSTPLFVAVDSV